jgi:hypothetical protein
MTEPHPAEKKPHPAEKKDVVDYWTRILQVQEDQNPINEIDLSTNPVYLVGNFGGTTNTRLPNPISSKQTIFVPVNQCIITEPEAGGPSEDLEKIAEDDESSATQADLEIDGVKHNIKERKYRVFVPRFPVGPPTGQFKAAADGYYVLIDPLRPGEHKIIFEAEVRKPFSKNEKPVWKSKNIYTFEVR